MAERGYVFVLAPALWRMIYWYEDRKKEQEYISLLIISQRLISWNKFSWRIKNGNEKLQKKKRRKERLISMLLQVQNHWENRGAMLQLLRARTIFVWKNTICLSTENCSTLTSSENILIPLIRLQKENLQRWRKPVRKMLILLYHLLSFCIR